MLKGLRNDTFVCLDDITEHMEEMNYVIYNPSKNSLPFRAELLYRIIEERFGIKLTSDQINHLTKYEVHQLKDFVNDLKLIIAKAKNNE